MDRKFLRLLQKYNIKSNNSELSARLQETGRFKCFSAGCGDLLLDFSRTSLDEEALEHLLELAENSAVAQARGQLFAGNNINFTEQRPALHMGMRCDDVLHNFDPQQARLVQQDRERMFSYAAAFAAGHLPDLEQEKVRNIVHIGIGGSVLGPRLLIEALAKESSPQVHFLSSVDAHLRDSLLASLNPAETVVIIVSKSFNTGETLLHARRILQWLEQALGRDAAEQRLFAVSGNITAVKAFGVPEANSLFLPDWVGGRYSIWSSVSLAVAAVIGKDAFLQFLQGAADMDRHFQSADFRSNLPVLMALTGIWHRNVCNYTAQAVIPYDYRLRSLPAYLQQLVMESGGKSVNHQGEQLGHNTAPVVFGEAGTDAQHSLFQMFHQGSDIVPLTFIGVVRPDHQDDQAHAVLLANMLAQATVLCTGTTEQAEAGQPNPHAHMPGGRPSEIILLDELTPSSLGQLLALYEHKVFVESVIWGINPFDQYGVELGKVLANNIQPALEDRAHDIPGRYGLDGILKYIHSKK